MRTFAPLPLVFVAVLTFVPLVVGFSVPSLHGRPDTQEFQAVYRRHKADDED